MVERKEDPKTKMRFKSFQGGIGFPLASHAGFAVVIAEQLPERPRQLPAFHVVTTHEDELPGPLLRACAALGAKYNVSQWYCDTDDQGVVDLVYRSRLNLTLTRPPYLGDPGAIGTFVATIKDLRRQNRLHIMGGSLAARLLEVDADKKVQRMTKPQELPLLMALGAALTGMVQYPHDPHEMQRVAHITDVILSELHDD
jgi:hypothetical protein